MFIYSHPYPFCINTLVLCSKRHLLDFIDISWLAITSKVITFLATKVNNCNRQWLLKELGNLIAVQKIGLLIVSDFSSILLQGT